MITSRVTTKAQTTIPRSIRAVLQLSPGDDIVYVVDGAQVLIAKAPEKEVNEAPDNPFAAFSEWDGEDDDKAFANL